MCESMLCRTLRTYCARSQQYTKDSIFRLAQMTLCVITLDKFPPFVRPNVISDGPTNGFSIHQFFLMGQVCHSATNMNDMSQCTRHKTWCRYCFSISLILKHPYGQFCLSETHMSVLLQCTRRRTWCRRTWGARVTRSVCWSWSTPACRRTPSTRHSTQTGTKSSLCKYKTLNPDWNKIFTL